MEYADGGDLQVEDFLFREKSKKLLQLKLE
jgi:hypothetical protein